MKQPLVSIIILTYAKGLGHVKKCLTSLEKITYKNYEVILVDNCSTDNTVEYVKKHFPKVKLLLNKENLGFCGGNNVALKKAKGKYLLFHNYDTTVDKKFLEPLVDRLEQDNKIGAVQPKMRQLVEKDKLDACASFLTPTGFLYHFGYAQEQSLKKYNNPMEIYTVKGACFLARRDLIDRIGLFDEDFFAYFEETDFCHRVWLHGYKVFYEPTSEMYHLGGGDTKNDHPISLQFISYRNRIVSYIKNLEMKNLLLIMPFHIVLCLAVVSAYLFLRRPQSSIAILRAMGWNISHLSETLQKRKSIQKLRRVSEETYWSKIIRNPSFGYYRHFLLNPRGKFNYI